MGGEDSISRCAVAFALTSNLGDDVQSLVLSGLLRGGVRAYPRDFLAKLPEDVESGILSGWLSTNEFEFDGRWLAGKMVPLSFFLRSAASIRGRWLDHFQRHWLEYFRNAEVVMTRDTATRDRLREVEVEAEFGGCFSLFAARALPFPEVADAPYVVCTGADDFWALRAAGEGLVIFLYPGAFPRFALLDVRARISTCLFWLWLIRGAKAVYTDRLHASLPGISYGTGVFCRPTSRENPERFRGYESMLRSKDAQNGLVGADQIDEFTAALQQCGKHVPLLDFGFRREMSIREMYADLMKRGQFASTEEEIDAGFKRGAVLFMYMVKFSKMRGGGLPEVLSYARGLADAYASSGSEFTAADAAALLPEEFSGYAPEKNEVDHELMRRLRGKIKGMARRLLLK